MHTCSMETPPWRIPVAGPKDGGTAAAAGDDEAIEEDDAAARGEGGGGGVGEEELVIDILKTFLNVTNRRNRQATVSRRE